MKCPNCHKETRTDANFCEYCGFKFRKFEENLKDKKNPDIASIIRNVVFGLFIFIFIFIMIISALGNSSDTSAPVVESNTSVETVESEPISIPAPAPKPANTPSLDKISLISKGFGYTRFGEPAVVGKVKNNNNQALFIRADIDLLDSYGNVIGDTYTYENVQPYSVWNFEAPTFGVSASDMDVHLSIDKE